jgi:ribosomal protein L12E/L44/L45/RPP1/RPP2
MDCKPALAAVIAGMPIDKALTVLKESKAAAPPAPRVRGQEAGAGPKRLAEGKATVPQTDDPKELGAYLRGKD